MAIEHEGQPARLSETGRQRAFRILRHLSDDRLNTSEQLSAALAKGLAPTTTGLSEFQPDFIDPDQVNRVVAELEAFGLIQADFDLVDGKLTEGYTVTEGGKELIETLNAKQSNETGALS